jgi:chromosome segregation protein
MYLKELILHGFKSFALRTRMVLGPGVTTIVGPNGCGKSNIVDAIRWVLGEQSAKVLRGGKMDDVIFQGSDTRKPLPWCEVTLVFSDCEQALGTAFHEVEITRRVTRDGSSDYFLNGKRCRLRDIQTLFMDTGIGTEAYSFMMQGKIDQVLSNNPAERRLIFEEAAGITRYKTQRKDALAKLDQVTQNLTRLKDIFGELEQQKTQTERQALRALRHQLMQHTLKHLELAQSALRYQEHFEALQHTLAQRETLALGAQEQAARLAQLEEHLAHTRQQRSTHYEALQALQQTLFDRRSEKESLDNRLGWLASRGQDITQRQGQIEDEKTQLMQHLQSLDGRIAEHRSHQDEHRSQVKVQNASFSSQESDFQAHQNKLDATLAALREQQTRLAQLETQTAQAHEQLMHIRLQSQALQAQKASLGEQCLSGQGDTKQLERQAQELKAQLEDLNAARHTRHQDLLAANQAYAQQQEAFKAAQLAYQEQDRLYHRSKAKLQALEALAESLEGLGQHTQALLRGDLAQLLPSFSFQHLAAYVQVEPAYLPALIQVLNLAPDALLPLSPAASQTDWTVLLQTLCQQGYQDVCLGLPPLRPAAPKAGAHPAGTQAALQAFASLLRVHADAASNLSDDFVDKVMGWVHTWLEGCYLVPDLPALLRWINTPDGPDGLPIDARVLVSPEGYLWERRGFFRLPQGPAHQATHAAARAQTLEDLKARLAKEQLQLQAQQQHIETLHPQLQAAQEALEALRQELMSDDQQLAGLEAEQRSLQRNLAQKTQAHEQTQDKLYQLEDQLEALDSQQARAQRLHQDNLQATQGTKADIQALEAQLEALRAYRDDKRDQLSHSKVVLVKEQQQLEMLDQALLELESQKGLVLKRLQSLEQEHSQLSGESQRLGDDQGNAQARIQQLERYLLDDQANLALHREGLAQAESTLAAHDQDLKAARQTQAQHDKQCHSLDIRLTELRTKLELMAQAAQEQHQVSLGTLAVEPLLEAAFEQPSIAPELQPLLLEAESHWPVPQAQAFRQSDGSPDWPALEGLIRSLDERLKALGNVNPEALEQYRAVYERYTFMSAQMQDLEQAKAELLRGIEEINQTCQTLFMQTFEQVKQHFTQTFCSLFGGGEASLELQGQDSLEAGIHITAKPPGTRLRHLSLLSGGQKTMTAVALLFAIYQVKPSPFCVLDELDAPLDEANIDRFIQLLRRFTQYSQFLVISHNKRTIAASDILYGVTMQEKGVTSLISVKMQQPTAAPAPTVAYEPNQVAS